MPTTRAVTASSTRHRRRADGTVAHTVLYRAATDGRTEQRSRTFDTEHGAQTYRKLLADVGWAEAERIVDAHTDPASVTAPLLAAWLEHHLEHATAITAGTRDDYRRLAARTWLPTLGPYPVNALTRDHIARWVGAQAQTITRLGTPTSAKTITNAAGLLSTVLAAAVESGHRPDNPAHGIRIPRGHTEEMTFLTGGEFATLLAAIDEHWQPLVALLAGTGLRWGEATALRWRDLDLDAEHPTVRVARAWKHAPDGGRELGVPKTARSRRTVGLPHSVADLLRERRATRATYDDRARPDDLVFTTRRGEPVRHQNWRTRVWLPAIDRAAADLGGKRPRIHDLRHTYASWQIAAGAPLTVVQRQLGHSSITTTSDRYGHVSPDAGAATAAVADAALASALPQLIPGPRELTSA